MPTTPNPNTDPAEFAALDDIAGTGSGLTFAQDHSNRATPGGVLTTGSWGANSGEPVYVNNFVNASNVPNYALTSFTPGGEDVTFADDHLQRQQIGAQFVDDRLSGLATATDLPGVLIDPNFRTSEHAYTEARQDDLDTQNAIEFLTPGPTPVLHGAPHALPLPAAIAMPAAPPIAIPTIEIPTASDPFAPQFWNAMGDASPAWLSAFAPDSTSPTTPTDAAPPSATAALAPFTLPRGHTFGTDNSVLASRWQDVRTDLVFAADEAGIDAGTLAKIAAYESQFNSAARPISRDPASNTVRQFDGVMAMSSAYGFGQILNGTWTDLVRQNGEDYGVEGAGRFNESQAAAYRTDSGTQWAMFAELTATNIAIGQRMGGPDDAANIYALHNLGSGGGRSFLSALASQPDTAVSDVVGSGVASRNSSLYGDGSITVRQAYQNMVNFMQAAEPFAADARQIQHPPGH